MTTTNDRHANQLRRLCTAGKYGRYAASPTRFVHLSDDDLSEIGRELEVA